ERVRNGNKKEEINDEKEIENIVNAMVETIRKNENVMKEKLIRRYNRIYVSKGNFNKLEIDDYYEIFGTTEEENNNDELDNWFCNFYKKKEKKLKINIRKKRKR